MKPSTRAEVEDALVRYCRGEMLLCELCAVVGVPKPTPEQSRISDRARKAEAEVARLGRLVDDAVYYRNLAIMLGAKPEQMTNVYDRELCVKGIDTTPNDYADTMADQVQAYRAAWDAVDELKEMLIERTQQLREAEAKLAQARGDDP